MSLAKNRMVVYEDHKNASPFYECFNNVQHGVMKALKMCISLAWVFQKFASHFTKATKKSISFVRAHQQGASRFYEGGKNVHLRFMSLSKMRISIYEGRMRLQRLHTARSLTARLGYSYNVVCPQRGKFASY